VEATKALPSPRTPSANTITIQQQRRISALVQAQARNIEVGRDNFLNAADKIYESINGTLENSFQFVFGRFREHTSGDSPLPKTLEDARKLVSSPRLGDDDESLNLSGRSSPALDDPLNAGAKGDSKMLDLIGGRRQLRDRSADSSRSGGSNQRVAFEQVQNLKPREDPSSAASSTGNLFATINTINPLNRFSVPVPGFARFGRSGSVPTTPSQSSPAPEKMMNKLSGIVESPVSTREADLPALEKQRSRESNGEELNAREALAELRKLKPPKKRFLEVQTAGELKLSEIDDLLMEYRRLAKAIGKAIAM
jgi:hypothetical protein